MTIFTQISKLVCIINVLMISNSAISQESISSSQYRLAKISIEELKQCIEKSEVSECSLCEDELVGRGLSDLELANVYKGIGIYFYKKASSDLSALYFQKAVHILKKGTEKELLCDIYMKQGNAYLQGWRNQKALDAYQVVLDMAIEKKDSDNRFKAQSTRAIVLKRMNQLHTALSECKESLGFIDQTSFKNKKNHVNVLTILSEIYLDLEEYDSVIYYADQGILLSKRLGYQKAIADLYIKKGWSYYQKKDTTQALEYLHAVEEIVVQEKIKKNANQAIKVNYYLATHYYNNKSYGKAIESLLKTIDAIEENDLRKDRVVDTQLLLAKSYQGIGDAKKSSYWFAEYEKLRAIFQKKKDKTTNKIHYESDQRLDKKLRKSETRRVILERYKQYALVVLVSILVVLVFIVWKFAKKQKSNTILFDQLIQKISMLESHKQTVKEKELSKVISIDDEKINNILKGLDRLERQEYFLNLDCNLRSMAKKVKTNATYLSKIINTYKHKSFNDYINDLRIEYALKRLKNDKKFRSFSVKSIAHEIGYKSDNSFTKHFKLKTGLNPSYYIKNIEKLAQQILEKEKEV